jgi:predicted nucleic acid-binding protein
MPEVVLLDSGPLGVASHPRPVPDMLTWISRLLAEGVQLLVPEIADYEVRRELIRANRVRGLQRLDEMKTTLGYLPITTTAMLRAAELWADARRRGKPTASDASLDADVILAGQAFSLGARDIMVASSNPKHLSRFVAAEYWQNIHP